jgi:hypothetical protein
VNGRETGAEYAETIGKIQESTKGMKWTAENNEKVASWYRPSWVKMRTKGTRKIERIVRHFDQATHKQDKRAIQRLSRRDLQKEKDTCVFRIIEPMRHFNIVF